MRYTGKFVGGGKLICDGKIVSDNGQSVREFHFDVAENASGYIVIIANNLEEAVVLSKTCPIFSYGGNVTIRPVVEEF